MSYEKIYIRDNSYHRNIFTITNVYAENEYPDSGWEIPTIKGEVVIKWRIMEIETITDQTK